ncbi:MAG: NADH:flavin oxidoreductase/NADH oxidase [Mesorhizobium sp.]
MTSLFKEGRIGGLKLDNRIVVSPMCMYSAVAGVPQPFHMAHIGSLMMSGAGLVIVEATAVDAVGRGTPGCTGLYDDAQEAAFAKLVADSKGLSGAKLGIQLTHTGRKAAARTIPDRWRGEPLPREEGAWKPVAPSAIAFDSHWQTPEELSIADIRRLVEAFADSARRADRCGFDLVEIHGAHGYLIHQFLSPLSNQRTDAYGGSTAGRNRFAIEIARAVRAVWPKEKALGFRMNSTDWHADGLVLEDAVVLAQALEAEGIDYVVMSSGNIAPGIKIPPATPGHQVRFAAEVKKRTRLTTMAVGMIARPDQADGVIASGDADFVAIARVFLDDPRWGIHAAAALGVDIRYAPQYIRARPNNWLGFSHVHPDARPPATKQQLDRPPSVAWDRPPEQAETGAR